MPETAYKYSLAPGDDPLSHAVSTLPFASSTWYLFYIYVLDHVRKTI